MDLRSLSRCTGFKFADSPFNLLPYYFPKKTVGSSFSLQKQPEGVFAWKKE